MKMWCAVRRPETTTSGCVTTNFDRSTDVFDAFHVFHAYFHGVEW